MPIFQSFFKGRGDAWLLLAVVLALIVMAPLAAVLFGVGRTGPEWEYVFTTLLGDYVKNTLILIGLVSVLSVLMAIPAAWLVVTHEFLGRRVFEWALVLPLAFPTYVGAFVYLQLPESLIPALIFVRQSYGMDAFLWCQTLLRYGLLAVVLASVLFPYVYLTARASFANHSRVLIEVSQVLGRSSLATFFKVALPLSRPAIIAGLSLVVMEVLNDYGAVNLLGVPTLADGVFRTWFGLEDRNSAIRLAGLMTTFVLVLLACEYIQRGRRSYAETNTDTHPMERLRLSRWGNIAAFMTCVIPLALGLLFPVWQLVRWVVFALHESALSGFSEILWRSLGVAAASAMIIVAIGMILAFTARTSRSRTWRGGFRVATLGYAMPGAVVAVGIMVLTGLTDRLTAPAFLLSGSVAGVTFGYVTRFLAVSYQPITTGMERLCGKLDEASQLLGRGQAATLWHVIFPLMRRPLLAAGMLVFVDILKELPLTMILRPANFETLATKAFSLAKEGRIHESALPSLCIVVAGIAVLLPLNRWLRGTAIS